MANIVNITLYLVGQDEAEAQESLYFAEYWDARDYAREENPGAKIFAVQARIDFDTMHEE
jgi:hypothetical protein